MAGIDTGGGHGGRRSLDHNIPLVPFIDFLLCLVSFLLITAVWSEMSRLNADARVPGPPNPEVELTEEQSERVLHVEIRDDKFELLWKTGTTVVDSSEVTRRKEANGDDFSFPELAKKVTDEWNTSGAHRSDSDLKRDQAVLHTDNSTQFQDIIAVIDAIYAPQRKLTIGGREQKVPAFNVTFAVN
jgi:biopolymer transport protein ExbD